jgi:flagellin-specific chaperone FliS
MSCDILLLEPIRFMFMTQMHLIDDIVSIHSIFNDELKNKHKMKNKMPISHTMFSLFKDYNENLLEINLQFQNTLISEIIKKFQDTSIQEYLATRIKKKLDKLAVMADQSCET